MHPTGGSRAWQIRRKSLRLPDLDQPKEEHRINLIMSDWVHKTWYIGIEEFCD